MSRFAVLTGVALGVSLLTGTAAAQGGDQLCTGAEPSSLLGMSNSALRSELDQRYRQAASTADATAGSSSTVFNWANAAAAQCAIAYGFARTGHQDANSINRCDCFSNRLTPFEPEPPVTPPPDDPPVNPMCDNDLAVTVYFAWDSADLNPQTRSVLDQAASEIETCGLDQAILSGHTDLSGSDSYNQELSERRADAVSRYLTSIGISADLIEAQGYGESRPAEPTPDGVREPLNRRVEAQVVFTRRQEAS